MAEIRQKVKKAVEKEHQVRDEKLSDLKKNHKEQDANRRGWGQPCRAAAH